MTYRSDHEALEHKLAQLEQELTQVRAERTRLEAAALDEDRLVRDLDRVRTELHARAPRRLPLLENLHVASPCHERWDAMTGDAHARHCARCDKNVYDLSSMTREEAHALLADREGELCVRYYARADGTILTADCPVGVRLKRLRYVAAGAVSLMVASAAAFAFSHTTASVRMGDVAPPSAPTAPSAAPPSPPTLLPVGDLRPPPVLTAPPEHPTPYVPPMREVMGRRVSRPQ